MESVLTEPRLGFYTNTYLKRSEVFFHRQARGMQNATVSVFAEWGTNLPDFPIDDLHLVNETRRWLPRARMALARRLEGTQAPKHHLADYAARRIAKELDRREIDLIYCIFAWNAMQAVDVLDRMKRPVPLVWLAGGSDINAATSFGDAYERRLLEACDRAALVLAGSEFLRQRVLALGVPPQKVERHYIGIDIPECVLPRPAGRDELRLLAVSRLVPVKGVPHTLRAFARVVESLPEAKLEIIGDGPDRTTCIALAVDLGIAERVTFHGGRTIDEVYAAMARSDIFVQHNVRSAQGHEESISGTMLEASAHGLPVVVTRSGGNSEGMTHGGTGFLVEPGDEAGMANAILALAQDPDLRTRMGLAGRDRMMRDFDVKSQNAKLETMLTETAIGHDPNPQ